jgi:hypothetical protein
MQPPIEAGPFRVAANDLTAPTRSIQIARTLMDRYAELVRQGDGGLLGLGTRNVDNMELIIGEASQIYPEIWSNLDAAYAALQKRGVDVPQYPALRGSGSNGSGILGVDVRSVGLGYNRSVEKTAAFDAAGNARARQASDVLRRAMPTVDWTDLDQKDAALMAEAARLGPSKASKVIVGVIGMLLAGVLVSFYLGLRLGLFE